MLNIPTFQLEKDAVKSFSGNIFHQSMYDLKTYINESILKILIKKLSERKIAYFYQSQQYENYKRIQIWTQSSRKGVLLQLSHIVIYNNGDIEPHYHENINSYKDALRSSYWDGIKISIKK